MQKAMQQFAQLNLSPLALFPSYPLYAQVTGYGQYCTALCTVLLCVVLLCVVLYCSVYCTALCTVLLCVVLYCSVYCTALCIVLLCVVLYLPILVGFRIEDLK